MSTYAKLPVDAFKKMSFNAGTIATSFNPETGELKQSDVVGATTGGMTFNSNLETADFAEDVDQAKSGTKQFFMILGCDPHLTGTMLTIDETSITKLVPASKVTKTDGLVKVVPTDSVDSENHFFDLWLITDFSNVKNDSTSDVISGYFAIHMMNCINTTGFNSQTTKDGKTQFSVDFKAFYDAENPDIVPYEIYYKSADDISSGTGD